MLSESVYQRSPRKLCVPTFALTFSLSGNFNDMLAFVYDLVPRMHILEDTAYTLSTKLSILYFNFVGMSVKESRYKLVRVTQLNVRFGD